MKKLILVIMAVSVLALMLTPCCVFAAGEPAFVVSSANAAAGDTVEITISLKNNPGIASAKLKVEFDSDLILKTAAYGGEMGGTAQKPSKYESPVTLNWFNGTKNSEGDFDYAYLTFAVSEKAKQGEHKITLSYNPNDVFGIDEKSIDFKIENGKIVVGGDGADTASVADSAVIATGESAETANTSDSSKSDDGVEYDPQGIGDYTGEEIDPFNPDVSISESDVATVGATGISAVWIWVSIGAVVVLIAAAVFVLLKKSGVKEEDTNEE